MKAPPRRSLILFFSDGHLAKKLHQKDGDPQGISIVFFFVTRCLVIQGVLSLCKSEEEIVSEKKNNIYDVMTCHDTKVVPPNYCPACRPVCHGSKRDIEAKRGSTTWQSPRVGSRPFACRPRTGALRDATTIPLA